MSQRSVLASALLWMAALSALAAEPPFSIGGKWNTDFGAAEFTENNGKVTGIYAFENGKFTGTRSDNRVIGQWTQGKSTHKCDAPVDGSYFHGRFVFDFTANEYVGKWGYCDDTPVERWSGKRVADSPTPAASGVPAPCPQCPPWVAQSANGSYLPLASKAEIWSDPKPFKRKSGNLTVQSRFMGQLGTTCKFEVQFNNVDSRALDERIIVARPGKAAVSQYDSPLRAKLAPGASVAYGTEVRECPLNWGETKDMAKCAACEPLVYFVAD